MEIIDRIRWIMEERGLKKSQLAKRIGVSEGNVGDWFRGRSRPGLQVIINIAREFKVSTDWLLTGEVCLWTLDEESKKLLDLFYTLDHEKRKDLFKYLDYLVYLAGKEQINKKSDCTVKKPLDKGS